ncbi:hypothetical protein SUGI_1143080 [Cryptomeria japonica]|nr:hypothetical protein SUGI_1143080 [Cryptomeria japonica]
MTQVLTGQDTNNLNKTAVADAKKEHEQDKNGNVMEHQGGERTTRTNPTPRRKKLKESKFLLSKKAIDKEVSEEDKAWLASRTEPELDMLISIKKMAMERAKTIQDERANGIFNFKLLRTIGLLLEEFVKESLKNAHSLGDVVETPTVPSEKDEGRIPLEKEREHNHIKPIVKVELEEMTTSDVTKRKRNSSGEQEDVHLKKRKKKRHRTTNAES